jgi:mevalonate kinase
MDTNFDLRRRMFGDGVLGPTNLDMIAAARSVGAAAKFTGSGGAILALCPQGAAQEQALQGGGGGGVRELVEGVRCGWEDDDTSLRCMLLP